MDKIKEWIIEVALKRMGPSAVRGAILAFAGLLVAKAGILAAYGITYDAVTRILTINLDGLTGALILLLGGSGAAIIKMLNYHADVAVKTVVQGKDATPPPVA